MRVDPVLLSFPPRAPTLWEREQVRRWTAAVSEFTAYVSERRGDDPAIYRRIAISRRAARRPCYIIHAPQGFEIWIVASVVEGEDIVQFPTLQAALEFVKPADRAAEIGAPPDRQLAN